MTVTRNYELHQLEQVLSLLKDQRECLTLRSVMLELTVNRGVARSIMEEVARLCEDDSDAKYCVVRMVFRSVGDGCASKRSVELVADGSNEGSVFSIALVLPPDAPEDEDDVDEDGNPIEGDGEKSSSSVLERLSAAHEKALATQRERLLEGGQEGELFEIFGDMSILPAAELCEENDGNEQGGDGCGRTVRRVKRGRELMQLSGVSSSGTAGRSGKSKLAPSSDTAPSRFPTAVGGSKAKSGKPTTAAAFFGKAAATKSKAKAAKKDDDEKTEKNLKTESPSEKENKSNGKSNSKSVGKSQDEDAEVPKGTADDFVGDVDEDDDFLEEEKARKARVAKEARQMARKQISDDNAKRRNTSGAEGRRSMIAPEKRRKRVEEEEEEHGREEKKDSDDISDSEENEYDDVMEVENSSSSNKKRKEKEKTKKGAMDAFAKKVEQADKGDAAASAAGGGAKKRRKRLVERTTVDDSGYMCTETVTVWEDVSDDEAEEAKVENPSSKLATAAATKASAKGDVASKGKAKSGGGGGKKKQAGLMGFFATKKK